MFHQGWFERASAAWSQGGATLARIMPVFLLLISSLVHAQTVVDLGDPSNFDARFDGAANQEALALGWAVTDVNGDGWPDLVLGGYSAYVVLGRPDRKLGSFDLADPASWDTRFRDSTGDPVEHFEAAGGGDLNGDGVDDLVIANYQADNNGRPGSGSVWVIFGGAGFPTGDIDLADPGSYDIRYDGAAADGCGSSVATGDLSGDSIADLVIGSYSPDFSGRSNAGKVWVVFGGPAIATGIRDFLAPDQADVLFGGPESNALLGGGIQAVLVGDLDADGIGDAIMAVPGLSGTTGGVFVVRGGATFPTGVVDLADPANWYSRYDGAPADDSLGHYLASADVNGDANADLLMSSPWAGFGPTWAAGSVYVVFGGTGLPAGVRDLSDPASYDIRFDGDPSDAFLGEGVHLGEGLAAGDMNGDGLSDVVMGAPARFTPTGWGSVYVVHGGPLIETGIREMGQAANFNVRYDASTPELVGTGLGNLVMAADVDGDLGSDLVMAGSANDSNGRSLNGVVVLVYGSTPPSSVGPTGGTVAAPPGEEGEVEVPAGALTNYVLITVGRAINPPAMDPPLEPVGYAVEFGPDGQQFAQAVTINLPYPVGQADPNALHAYRYSTVTSTWEEVTITNVDTTNRIISIETTGFSTYQLATVETAGAETESSTSASGSSSSGGGSSPCFVRATLGGEGPSRPARSVPGPDPEVLILLGLLAFAMLHATDVENLRACLPCLPPACP